MGWELIMAYEPDVPKDGNEPPSASQPKITANFQTLDEIFGKDHTKFSATGGSGGKHKFLTMPKQDAVPATGADEGALYLKEVNSTLNLFLRQQNSGTEANLSTRNVIDLTTGADGKIVLNNDLIIIWGNDIGSKIENHVQRVPFPTAFKSIFWVNFNVQKQTSASDVYYLDNFKESHFDVRTNTSTERRYFYIAVGT